MLTTPWISRLAALLLLAVVAAAAYQLVVGPVVNAYADTRQAVADARDRLEHYERLAATRPALAAEMTALVQRQAPHGYYLSGGTDALAAVALQDRLKQVIGAKGGTTRSIQPLAGVDEHGFRRVTVRVQLTSTTEALFHIFYALEAGSPIVFIENIDIQSRAVLRTADRSGTPVPPEEPVLTIAFDLYGYLPIEGK